MASISGKPRTRFGYGGFIEQAVQAKDKKGKLYTHSVKKFSITGQSEGLVTLKLEIEYRVGQTVDVLFQGATKEENYFYPGKIQRFLGMGSDGIYLVVRCTEKRGDKDYEKDYQVTVSSLGEPSDTQDPSKEMN